MRKSGEVMDYIAGRNRHQQNLLPDCIEDYINEDNPVRVIDAYVEGLDMKALGFARSSPNVTGRPMYSPNDLLKLYLYGYLNRIRSSRRLEAETTRNLEVIWLINQLHPDHKTIARFRHDNPKALKKAFREFSRLCLKLDLYGRELLGIDGSKFRSVNSMDRGFNDAKLKDRISRIEARLEEYTKKMDELDKEEEATASEHSVEEIKAIVTDLTQRKSKYEGYLKKMKETGEKQVCETDPESRLMKSHGRIEPNYNVQTAVDSKNKLIVDFEVTNYPIDKNKLHMLTKRSVEILEVEHLTVTADTGYDSATDIGKCVMAGFEPHVAGVDITVCLPSDEPAEEITEQVKGRCIYLADRNIALCPMGHVMYPSNYRDSTRKGIFQNFKACGKCTCRCTDGKYKEYAIVMPKEEFRTTYNDGNLFIKQVRITPDRELVKKRKELVEHPFGTIKQAMATRYCLTKGLKNVSGEFSLTFLAYNLKRVINILGVKKLREVLEG
jgi:transposase